MRPPLTPPDFRLWQMSDGHVVRGRVWEPPAPARRLIVYLHGIQSHGGWFEWSASILAAAGHVVLLPDRRGSGLNDADRGDTPSAEQWLADVDALVTQAATEWPGLPLDLCGVSWGGKLAAAWAARRPGRAARLLLVAPGVFPAVDVTTWQRLSIGASLLLAPARRFPIPLSDPALFSDNPAGRRFVVDDRLKLTHATARFLFQSVRLDRALARLRPGALPIPITLALAGRDRIIRNDRTAQWLARIAPTTALVREFASAAHTLEFEADEVPFRKLLSEWSAAAPDSVPPPGSAATSA